MPGWCPMYTYVRGEGRGILWGGANMVKSVTIQVWVILSEGGGVGGLLFIHRPGPAFGPAFWQIYHREHYEVSNHGLFSKNFFHRTSGGGSCCSDSPSKLLKHGLKFKMYIRQRETSIVKNFLEAVIPCLLLPLC